MEAQTGEKAAWRANTIEAIRALLNEDERTVGGLANKNKARNRLYFNKQGKFVSIKALLCRQCFCVVGYLSFVVSCFHPLPKNLLFLCPSRRLHPAGSLRRGIPDGRRGLFPRRGRQRWHGGAVRGLRSHAAV